MASHHPPEIPRKTVSGTLDDPHITADLGDLVFDNEYTIGACEECVEGE